ncbi:MAG: hypothetical protein Q8R30_00165 [bacterium]|nr:hypothetical protein [bacterium]
MSPKGHDGLRRGYSYMDGRSMPVVQLSKEVTEIICIRQIARDWHDNEQNYEQQDGVEFLSHILSSFIVFFRINMKRV